MLLGRWIAIFLAFCLAILIPFGMFERELTAWTEAAVLSASNDLLLATVIIAVLAADVALPIPASIVGVMAGAALGATAGSIVVWTGLMAGTAAGFAIGSLVRRTIETSYLSHPEADPARRIALKYGGLGLVLMRPIPVLAELSVIGAGLIGYPLGRALVLTAIANGVISTTYAAIGAFLVNTEHWIIGGTLLLFTVVIAWERRYAIVHGSRKGEAC